MGPTHPPPPLKKRAFVWDLQMEHLPAVLVPLGLQGWTCVWSWPEAPLLPVPYGKHGERPEVVLLGSLERKCCLSKAINTMAEQSAQLHSSQKKVLSLSLPIDASSLLAPLSLLLPAASSSSLQPHLLPFATASVAVWGLCYYTYQSHLGCGLCK